MSNPRASATLRRRALVASAMATGLALSTGPGPRSRNVIASQTAVGSGPASTSVEWVSDATMAPLVSPHCLAISPAGRLHVVDTDRRVVSVFDNGVLVREWDDPALAGPVTGIAINSRSYIFLADAGAHAIRAYDPAGRPVLTIVECADGTRFSSLAGLMFAGDNALYVADPGSARVLRLNVPDFALQPDDTYLPDEPHMLP